MSGLRLLKLIGLSACMLEQLVYGVLLKLVGKVEDYELQGLDPPPSASSHAADAGTSADHHGHGHSHGTLCLLDCAIFDTHTSY